jgi:helicase MOV-10
MAPGVSEAATVAAIRQLLAAETGERLASGALFSRLFSSQRGHQAIVRQAGGARRFCERHANVLAFIEGGQGTIALAATASASPLVESASPLVEAARRILTQRGGSMAAGELASGLYGHNPAFRQLVQSDGGLRRFCERHAGVFQFVAGGAGTVTLVARSGTQSRGSTTQEQESRRRLRIEKTEACRRAAELFWAFLQRHSNLMSNDRAELSDTYTAWREEHEASNGALSRANPSGVLHSLAKDMKVLRMQEGTTVMYRSTSPRAQTTELPGVPREALAQPLRRVPARMSFEGAQSGHVPYEFVDTVRDAGSAAERLVQALLSRPQTDGMVLAVDLEWQTQQTRDAVSLIQIAAPPNVVVLFDVLACPEIMEGAVKAMLTHKDITKVLHDCREDEAKLQRQFGWGLVTVFDTSATDTVLKGVPPHARSSLNAVLQLHTACSNTSKHQVDHTRWGERPLPATMLEYAAQDVAYLVDVYFSMMEAIGSSAYSPQLQAQMNQRTVENLTAHTKAPQTRVAAVRMQDRALLDRLKQDTADAFHAYLLQNVVLQEQSDARAQFKEIFGNWKTSESEQGRTWRGGAEHVRLKLVREGLLKVRTQRVVQQPGQSIAEAARIAAEHVHEQRSAIENDKGGISVTTAAAFSPVVQQNSSSTCSLLIKNTGQQMRRLTQADQVGQSNAFTYLVANVSLSGLEELLPMEIAAHTEVRVDIRCCPRGIGVVRTILSLTFDCGQGRGRFTIGRFLEVQCVKDAELAQKLRPVAPYERKKRKARPPTNRNRVIPGEGLPSSNLPPYVNELDFANCSSDWRNIMRLGEADEWLAASQQQGLTTRTYAQHWQRLLWTEETQLEADIREFEMEGQVLQQQGRYLSLRVPGLAENRPSVLKGDTVRVRLAGQKQPVWSGVAHGIRRDYVDLMFAARFHHSYVNGQPVDVEFVLNRIVMRLFHQGCKLANQLPERTLYPGPLQNLSAPRAAPMRNPANSTLNFQQLQAVAEIVKGVARPTPYLLFGPPGTGKTVTLVESIWQIYHQQSGAKILACAPTNTAADLLVERLKELGRHAMLRIMAHSRPREAVNELVMPFTLSDGDSFVVPTLEQVTSYRIVVSTLASAAKLHNLGVARGHFTTICVDEGGQSFEPEAIAPVAPLLGANGQLVIAGDPKQLGPIVHSSIASENGLAISLLERLIGRPVYAKDLARHPDTNGYDPRVLTKLINNYRAHEKLLALPNRLFYDGELQPRGNPVRTRSLIDWEHLPRLGVPLIFHGVEGKDEREANSPSWFNVSEIEQVMQYVEWLLSPDERYTNQVAAKDIGIITPYAKQKQKLRTALGAGADGHRSRYQGIKVGSTEEFQGQERRVIILTTVRTSRAFIESDARHNLGFLANPKRFNVAVTRAQALMIVVGDPRVLQHDDNWGELLRYCVAEGAYTGAALPEARDDAAMDALSAQMQSLLRDDEEGVPDDDDELEQEDGAGGGGGGDDEECEDEAPVAVVASRLMMQEQLPIDRNE